ncbi:hypothetical protein ADIS_3633 [Lunatimonas lonarensis]|uniref:Uncharacterized protein n=1 Tax=Lunatimonas lonarensis TaxID=1232681 RepID=R7ZP33_9BACT|nr:hypothetical protein ADIS_3633 [Lunatimonas lonarensis]
MEFSLLLKGYMLRDIHFVICAFGDISGYDWEDRISPES